MPVQDLHLVVSPRWAKCSFALILSSCGSVGTGNLVGRLGDGKGDVFMMVTDSCLKARGVFRRVAAVTAQSW